LDIKEFLRPYPEMRVAGPQDNDEILAFFARTDLKGRGFNLTYRREPDFFAFIHLHSDDALVLTYRNELEEIQGLATFVFRDAWVQGQIVRACYLGDLRIGADRGASRTWRRIYSAILTHKKEIEQFRAIEVFYTCLIDENTQSRHSLSQNKKSGFRYSPVAPYSMVTLLARRPVTAKAVGSTIGPAASLPSLLSFYESHDSEIPTGYVYQKEIPRRLQRWPELSLKDFFLVSEATTSAAPAPLAACAFWSPRKTKRIMLSGLPWALRALLGFRRELKVLYVTHLVFRKGLSHAEKERAFVAILNKAWQVRKTKHYRFVAFCDFQRDSLKGAATGFFTNEVPMTVYEVDTQEAPAAEEKTIYGFEMALV
jgi:hypothetical protein